MMRWAAVAAWVVAAAFTFSQFLSNPRPMIPNDLGPSAICLVPAALIAVGGRIGAKAATVSCWIGGIVTVVGALASLSGFSSWPVVAGAAVLTLVTYLAAREMRRTAPA